MVWYGVKWYGMVWCGVVKDGVVWCDMVWYALVHVLTDMQIHSHSQDAHRDPMVMFLDQPTGGNSFGQGSERTSIPLVCSISSVSFGALKSCTNATSRFSPFFLLQRIRHTLKGGRMG